MKNMRNQRQARARQCKDHSIQQAFKFLESVLKSIGAPSISGDDYEQAKLLRRFHVQIPKAIEEAYFSPVRHDKVCEANEMKAECGGNLKKNLNMTNA